MGQTCQNSFDVEKFDESNYFELWQVKMRAVLVKNGWESAIDKFMEGTYDVAKATIFATKPYKKAHNALLIYLGNKVLREIIKKTTHLNCRPIHIPLEYKPFRLSNYSN